MLIRELPALGVLFDINLLGDVWYGEAAWNLFLGAVDVRKAARGCVFASGDTIATLSGSENNYCIAVQHPHDAVLDAIRSKLSSSARYRRVNPSGRFLQGKDLYSEPLPQVGFVNIAGRLIGFPWSAESHPYVGFDGFVGVGGTGSAMED